MFFLTIDPFILFRNCDLSWFFSLRQPNLSCVISCLDFLSILGIWYVVLKYTEHTQKGQLGFYYDPISVRFISTLRLYRYASIHYDERALAARKISVVAPIQPRLSIAKVLSCSKPQQLTSVLAVNFFFPRLFVAQPLRLSTTTNKKKRKYKRTSASVLLTSRPGRAHDESKYALTATKKTYIHRNPFYLEK